MALTGCSLLFPSSGNRLLKLHVINHTLITVLCFIKQQILILEVLNFKCCFNSLEFSALIIINHALELGFKETICTLLIFAACCRLHLRYCICLVSEVCLSHLLSPFGRFHFAAVCIFPRTPH